MQQEDGGNENIYGDVPERVFRQRNKERKNRRELPLPRQKVLCEEYTQMLLLIIVGLVLFILGLFAGGGLMWHLSGKHYAELKNKYTELEIDYKICKVRLDEVSNLNYDHCKSDLNKCEDNYNSCISDNKDLENRLKNETDAWNECKIKNEGIQTQLDGWEGASRLIESEAGKGDAKCSEDLKECKKTIGIYTDNLDECQKNFENHCKCSGIWPFSSSK